MAVKARLCALGFGLLAGGVLGSALLFAAGLSRDQARLVLGHALWPPPVEEPPPETRGPCDIDPPVLTASAFDRSALAVNDAVASGQELALLHDQLGTFEEQLRSGDFWEAFATSTDFEERRALFAVRFGGEPAALDAWQPVRDGARRMLAEVSAGKLSLGDWTSDSNAALMRVMLLDVAGQTEEAEQALAAIRVQHSCGNCASERSGRLDDRRSEAAERRGDAPAALAFYDVSAPARFFGQAFHPLPRAAHDARVGLLMLEAGRRWEAVCLLQQVVDLRPGTPGADVARRALDQIGSLRERDSARLRRVYIDGRRPDDLLRKLAETVLDD